MAPAVNIDGLWGTPTATLDWCEKNYEVTPYIAEFWNTITNVVMIFPPLFGAIYFWKSGLEIQYILSNLCLLLVGIGSWMFHMTLIYEMQLMDELPMIYGTAVFLYAMANNSTEKGVINKGYVLAMAILCVTISVVYLYWKNPIFHQVSYSLMVALLLYETVLTAKRQPQIVPLALTSTVLYGCGIAVWIIDNEYCGQLKNIRTSLHPGLHMITQFHGLWHVFTGLATNLHILMSAYARSLELKKKCSIKVHSNLWPYLVHDEDDKLE